MWFCIALGFLVCFIILVIVVICAVVGKSIPEVDDNDNWI